MFIDDMKKSILQKAIQGKLVPQNPNDEPASELLKRIREEKEKLMKEGKIKKEKSLTPITDEEKTFEVPSNWEWVRLGEIATKVTDGTHSTPKYTTEGVPFLSVKNMSSGKIIFDDLKYITKEEHDILYKRCNPEKGDLLISKVGTTGVPAIVETDKEFSLFVSLALVKSLWDLVDVHYLWYVIQSPIVQEQVKENTRGIGNKNWVLDAVISTYFPLPPLEEQKRIVAKLDELMPLLDEARPLEEEITKLEKDFPSKLRQSILQYAIQGKLVEQNSGDEPASELLKKIKEEKEKLIKDGKIKKEKPLEPITDEEKPFEIPSNWEWCRWGNIVNIVSSRRVHQKDWTTEGVPFYRAREIGKLADYGFVDNDLFISENLYSSFSSFGVPHVGDLMVTAVGTLGKTYVVKETDKFYYKDASVICFENFGKLDPFYLRYVMCSELMKNQIRSNSNGTAVDTLTMVRMVKYFIPLPPLEEQKRIVAKLDELMKLCNELEEQIG